MQQAQGIYKLCAATIIGLLESRAYVFLRAINFDRAFRSKASR